jgi:hypothetical protein
MRKAKIGSFPIAITSFDVALEHIEVESNAAGDL